MDEKHLNIESEPQQNVEIQSSHYLSLEEHKFCIVSYLPLPAGDLSNTLLEKVISYIAMVSRMNQMNENNRLAVVVDFSDVRKITHNFRSLTELFIQHQSAFSGNKLDSVCFIMPQNSEAAKNKFHTFYGRDLMDNTITSKLEALKHNGKPNIFKSREEAREFFCSRVSDKESEDYEHFFAEGFMP